MKGMLKALTAVAMATAFTASTAHAQTPVSFGVGGGVNIPLSDFGDAAKLGFQGTALVEFAPANLPVGFRVDGTYQQNNFSDDLEADGKFQQIYGTADVMYTFKTAPESRIHPYLIAGGGVYNMKAKVDGVGDSGSDTKFGVNGGAGFNMSAGSATVFLEARFHNVFTSDDDTGASNTNFIPITIGVKFGG
ncbi:MAG TPA: outer membrane beta-barrel protein [Gemmatimonadales bacterium]|nr:outer membrane beta-barrel protein [Gemmatimonadales bacterium]